MKLALKVSEQSLSALEKDVERTLIYVRPQANAAMRDRFYEIVMNNFGYAGAERPWSWERLSPKYAEKVGRKVATLEVSGALKAAVMKGGAEGASVTVSLSNSDIPYATAHHDGVPFGNRSHPGLPGRRVFPMDENGEVTDWAREQIVEAAQKALADALS